MKNFNAEMIEKAKAAKSAEELLELAKANGMEITADEAATYFAQLGPKSGELNDNDLDAVAGGGCNDDERQRENEDKVIHTIVCPKCGETYAEFQKTGMLGCAACYQAFRRELEPVITRVQGRTQHAGRRPPVSEEEQARQTRMEELRTLMEAAVAQENFEEAARLRDELRAMTPAREAKA